MSLKEKMTALADAVREKAELTDTLTIDEMTAAITDLVVNGVEVDARALTVTPSKSQQNFTSATLGEHVYYNTVTVNAIPAEYITTNDATAVSGDILDGKTAYVNGRKVTGNMTNHGDVVAKFNNFSESLSMANGFFHTLVVTLTKKELTITPSAKTQTFNVITDEESDVFYSKVTVDPIPAEYITTNDADASGGDIFEGKTAYVKGEKITGTLKEAQQASVEANAVTVFPGVVTEGYSVTVEEMADIVADGNTVTVPTGYNGSEKNITVGTAKEAETFTPGTSDITIPADTYLTGNQVIKGDGNLAPENIKTGVSIFDIEGTFTSDADAEASDIALGKIAYVKGEKVTGTASGGETVVPHWHYRDWKIQTRVPACKEFGVPARGRDNSFKTCNGGLWWFRDNYLLRQADSEIYWTYVYTKDYLSAIAIGDGKLYKVSPDPMTITPMYQSISNVTQCVMMDGCEIFCCADGALYAGNNGGKAVRVEYTRKSDSDPITYVFVTKILNHPQDYNNFWVITGDGSLAHGWIDTESFDGNNPRVYAEIENESIANGNPFVNYFPQQSDGYEDSYSATCEFAFRTDGLWYRKAGTYWDGSKSRYHEWRKANDPGFRKTDWLGYCSTSASENWGWDEESEEEYVEWRISESQAALHIDTKGRLWKLSLSGSIVDNSFMPSGLNIVQMGEDTDWQCVPSCIARGQGQQGRPNNTFGQKGGKLINIWMPDTDNAEVLWEEIPQPQMGKMVCTEGSEMYFVPEGVTVDLSKAGGTF